MSTFKMLSMTSTLGDFRQKFENDKDFRNYCWYVRSLSQGVTDTVMATLLGTTDSTYEEYSVSNWATNVSNFVLAGNSGDKVFNNTLKNLGKAFPASLQIENLWDTMTTSPDLNWGPYFQAPQPTVAKTSSKRRGRVSTALTDREGNFREQLKRLLLPSQKDRLIHKIEAGKCRQMIFTGAPGTGKTYIAKAIAEYMEGIGRTACLPGEKTPYVQIQFHPSYDYTDFVEGLRPVELPQPAKKTADTDTPGLSSSMTFAKVDGHFKAFCRKVIMHGDPEKLYFFIIDEINRANLSKVFGELMYSLEKDKRGEKHGVKTQYQKLRTYDTALKTYLAEPKDGSPSALDDCFFSDFYIPENVVVIGTMNDIDRSVESMDYALRRRFEWVEFEVENNVLTYAFAVNPAVYGNFISSNPALFVKKINALNDHIINTSDLSFKLSQQYFISQGHFANLPEDVTTEAFEIVKSKSGSIKTKSDREGANVILDYVWEHRLHSLLREYLRGEDEKTIEDFLTKAERKFKYRIQDNRTKETESDAED